VASLLIAMTHAMAAGMDVVHDATASRSVVAPGVRAGIEIWIGWSDAGHDAIAIGSSDADRSAIAIPIETGSKSTDGRKPLSLLSSPTTAAFCPTKGDRVSTKANS
jgi:hypothetical protein